MLHLIDNCIKVDKKSLSAQLKNGATKKPVRVHNFEVSNQHVYHVSFEGLLVHNAKNEKGKEAKSQKRSGQTKTKSVRKANLNSNDAVSNFGIYDIRVNGFIFKIGKADLNRVTKSTVLPGRLLQQIQELKKVFGKENAKGFVIKDLGTATTLCANQREHQLLKQKLEELGYLLLGNWKSFKP